MKTCATYVLVLLTFLVVSVRTTEYDTDDHDWDYLLFVQHWPFTICWQWEEKNPHNNCTLPEDNTQWTIHGIWPTKIDTEGPNFCNSSWHFNKTELEPILTDLEQYWTNIEANTKLTALWKHEWQKHGTCATVPTSEVLNTEINYFQQGLTWSHTYSIGTILAQNNVLPRDKGYSVREIHDSIKKVLNKNPIIQCVVDYETKDSYISEVRLCFNKTLDLIDCDISKIESFWDYFEAYMENTDILTNCDANKAVLYVKHLPIKDFDPVKNEHVEKHNSYIEELMHFYNVLQFLIWVTI